MLALLLVGAQPFGAVQTQPQSAPQGVELIESCQNGQVDRIKSLLNSGADPNYADNTGRTPIIAAVDWPEYDLVWIERGPRHTRIAEPLLNRGANIDHQDRDGMTALMHAIRQFHPVNAQALIVRGANVTLRDKQHRTALTWAAAWGSDDAVVKALLSKGVHVDLVDSLLLQDQVTARKLAPTGNLQARGRWGEVPLMLAARNGYLDVVRSLISRKANPNALDKQGVKPLMYALGGQRWHSLQDFGFDLVMYGSKAGRVEIVRTLWASGADPNGDDDEGHTALMWAAALDSVEVARELLVGGANVRQRNSMGKTALDIANEQGSRAVIALLMKAQR